MENICILDGDLIYVHKTNNDKNGQVVVARVEDEVTVKRLEKKGDLIYLHPENDELEAIVVDPRVEYIEIEGIAVGVIRSNAWM